MAEVKQRRFTDIEERIIKSAQEGNIKAFCDALLEHPEDGRLLRTLALEDQAVEWQEFRKRIFETAQVELGDVGAQSQNRNP